MYIKTGKNIWEAFRLMQSFIKNLRADLLRKIGSLVIVFLINFYHNLEKLSA